MFKEDFLKTETCQQAIQKAESHDPTTATDAVQDDCPCDCGHVLTKKLSGVMQWLLPGGTPEEYTLFIRKRGGLCYNCFQSGCKEK